MKEQKEGGKKKGREGREMDGSERRKEDIYMKEMGNT